MPGPVGRASAEQLTLLLSHEISNVLTAMRYNSRWAVVASYYEEDRNEPNKYDDAFRALKREIYGHSDWGQVDPMVYLTPFLSLLKASDVSGPITGTVAVALQRILASDLILPDTVNAEAAINQLVEDTTQGKFESTNNAQDEVVLLNIVQVLALSVECKASVLLSDETYCKAFQAAFMLGDPVTKPKEYGEIMGYYSRQVCGTMVRTLFQRLRFMAEAGAAAAATQPADASSAGYAPPSVLNAAHSHSHFLSQPVAAPAALPAAATGTWLGGDGLAAGSGGGASLTPAGTVPCLHGAKAAMEILDFLIELIKKKDEALSRDQIEETVVFALEMIHTALLAAGPALVQYDVLVAQVHVELLHAMCEAVVAFPALSIITGACQILSCLYACLGQCSIGQLELVITRVLLKLADGKGIASLEQQEVALEGLLDLVRTPGFVHDIFVNCDCRLERSNLYEELCGLLSRTAHPAAKGALGPLHLVSLDALTAILQAIAAEGKVPMQQPPPPELELPCFVDIWTPMVSGQHPDLSPLLPDASPSAKAQAGGPAKAQPAAGGTHPPVITGAGGAVVNAAELAAAERSEADRNRAAAEQEELLLLRSAAYEKHLKQKVSLAIDHFNKDHKKGFQHLQALRLMPLLEGSPAAIAALAAAGDRQENVLRSIVSEDELAQCMGRFLHSCPGLNKTAIGELLGEPDAFYLKVLDAYTASFDFSDLKFDAGIRMFLESFRLPGEAQKIDRIINSFGKHFFAVNQGIFRNADAAYVLAYSVIMLNTDRHNSQVKKKMELEAFRRNLRGVNDNQDFPVDFLNEIFYGIIRTELRMTESASMDVSEQRLVELHQLSRTPRGHMVQANNGRHLFDARMFQLVWSPAVSAMCAIIDNVRSEAVVEAALNGLQLAATVAAAHQLDDVADVVVSSLAKIPMQLTHITPAHASVASSGGSQRPDVVFGRDARMRVVTRTIAAIANRHGDSLTSGWVQFLELLVVLYRQGILPDAFTRALDGDGEGGLAVRDGEGSALRVRRLAAARAANTNNRSLFISFASMLGGTQAAEPVDPYGPNAAPLSESDQSAQGAGEALLARCAFEDIFLDSKFLKQESLVHLVRAVIAASGPIPRPTAVGLGVGVTGSLAYTAGGAPISAGWDVSELMLELLFGILLRNRDRIAALWPAVYEHLHAIFSHSREVDPMLVQKAVMAVMRLCLRLLPYKPHISEPLVKGVQLVSLVDEQVASEMATTIATELLSLLKAAAPYLQTQQVWVALTGLLKIIQYDPPSFPACVEALSWVVREGLTALNFPLILIALVDLIERAAERSARGAPLTVSASMSANLGSGGSAVTPRTFSSPPTQPDGAGGDGSTEPLLGGTGPDSTSPQDGPGSGGVAGPVGDPVIAVLLVLLKKTEEWLEVWWVSVSPAGSSGRLNSPNSGPQGSGAGAGTRAGVSPLASSAPDGGDPAVAAFQQEAWSHVMSSLCRAIKNPNLQVRLGALDCLQRSVVAAEKFLVPPNVVQRVLLQLLVPMTADMCKLVAASGPNTKEYPQADVSVRELVRALAKVVLLYAPLMGNAQPTGPAQAQAAGSGAAEPLVVGSTWGPAWRAILDCMVQGMAHAAPRSEVLAEAIPEALKNMVLMLHAKGALREGWRDASDGTDLHDSTWRAARKVSANLTPAILQLS